MATPEIEAWYGRVLTEHMPAIYRVLRRTMSREQASESQADVFLKAHAHREELFRRDQERRKAPVSEDAAAAERDPVLAYLVRTAESVALDAGRVKSREKKRRAAGVPVEGLATGY